MIQVINELRVRSKSKSESSHYIIILQTLASFLRLGWPWPRPASISETMTSSGLTSSALASAPSSANPDDSAALVDFRLRLEERFTLEAIMKRDKEESY